MSSTGNVFNFNFFGHNVNNEHEDNPVYNFKIDDPSGKSWNFDISVRCKKQKTSHIPSSVNIQTDLIGNERILPCTPTEKQESMEFTPDSPVNLESYKCAFCEISISQDEQVCAGCNGLFFPKSTISSKKKDDTKTAKNVKFSLIDTQQIECSELTFTDTSENQEKIIVFKDFLNAFSVHYSNSYVQWCVRLFLKYKTQTLTFENVATLYSFVKPIKTLINGGVSNSAPSQVFYISGVNLEEENALIVYQKKYNRFLIFAENYSTANRVVSNFQNKKVKYDIYKSNKILLNELTKTVLSKNNKKNINEQIKNAVKQITNSNSTSLPNTNIFADVETVNIKDIQ